MAISLLLLVISYFLKEKAWLSGALVSISCGGITGLTLYFLSNIRNNKIAKIRKEYDSLYTMNDILNKIIGFGHYHKLYRKMWGEKRNIIEDAYKVLCLIDELDEAKKDMPYSLYTALGFRDNDPLDYDNIRSLKTGYESAIDDENKMKIWLKEVVEYLIPFADKIHDPLNERKDQIMFLGKYFF
uniref:Uncharacterized protein n=1 Tax=uncultured Bacillota bacterium TaxID=344338 RepID=A0A650EN13_9FIRM|nr:hypothetical protein Firmicute1046_2160 [uncultured Firmicutes bacterium]